LHKDKKSHDAELIVNHLLKKGFVFEAASKKEFSLSIHRTIGHNQTVNLLPTLTKIFRECEKAENSRAGELVSELTSLLVAADLGLAREFLVELEVQKALPKMLHQLRKDLKSAASESLDKPREC